MVKGIESVNLKSTLDYALKGQWRKKYETNSQAKLQVRMGDIQKNCEPIRG